MNPVEYRTARRDRFREMLADVAVGVVTNLLVAALVAAARLVF